MVELNVHTQIVPFDDPDTNVGPNEENEKSDRMENKSAVKLGDVKCVNGSFEVSYKSTTDILIHIKCNRLFTYLWFRVVMNKYRPSSD